MFTPYQILKLIKGSALIGKEQRSFNNICIDSRIICAGDLFIPIKGKNFDGRDFIPDVLAKGASVLDTKNGLQALQTLAKYHRSQFKIPVIGITGSVGKTTTKDMLASVLSQVKPTLKNEENLNNEIGVPLTLLKLNKKHKFAVIEMAMQDIGEIQELADLVRPNIAIVTNIGEAHMQYLKTKMNIAKAKSEIFKYQTKNDFAVINADDEYFEDLKSKVKAQRSKVKTFGIIEKADVSTKELKGITIPLPGQHNIYNALATIAVAQILKINSKAIKKGIESFKASSKRLDIFDHPSGIRIINDTYNANPQSMEAALKVLSIHQSRKVAVLGDMFELGSSSPQAHKKIGKLVRKLKIDKLISVGKLSKVMQADFHYQNNQAAIAGIKKIIQLGDAVLIKGSRSMHMEKIVEGLTS